jgi:hypothetical protein
MQYVKHNKLKNTGVLFELLVRQITADTLALRENSPAVDILRKFMNGKTELGRELVLYRAFFNNTKPLSEARAVDLLNLVCNQRKKLNEKQLRAEKYNLISEIKKYYDLNEFLSVRVPSYKIYASVFKQFTVIAENVDIDIEQISTARFTILEHLTGHGTKPALLESKFTNMWREQEEDLRLLSYRMLLEKFNEKYASMTEKQKKLLRMYINNVSNSSTLREYIAKETAVLVESITKKLPKVPNKILTIKIHEVLRQLNKMSSLKEFKSNHMTGLLTAYEIDKELEHFQPL